MRVSYISASNVTQNLLLKEVSRHIKCLFMRVSNIEFSVNVKKVNVMVYTDVNVNVRIKVKIQL